MFLVNSRSHLVSAASFCSDSKYLHIPEAYLLPKLRYHFAEFLHPSCLIRLRILTLSTCVGLGYGLLNLKLRGFSWKLGISCFSSVDDRHRISTFKPPDLPGDPAYLLKPGQPTPGQLNLLRHPIAVKRGTGILTRFPSTTPFGLALGADSPCAE